MTPVAARADLQGRKKVRLRFRRNLEVVSSQEKGQVRYVVKDPISLRYYQLDAWQFFIVSRMDGANTLEDIQRAYEMAHRPQRLPLEELEGFAAQLVNDGLACNDSPLAGPLLWDQTQQQNRRQRRGRLLNFLSIKLPLFDPDRLFGGLLTWFGWLLGWWGCCLGLLCALMAGGLILCNWTEVWARLPGYQEFFTPATVVYLWLTYVAVKVLHEFGHGLCCRAFGGEVHEMGVLLILFFPALYCNVSDTWKLSSRWKRIAVSAAGIYVELVLASLATLLWWSSDSSSLLHHLCMSVMVVCGVSTLLVNANPLMRFDGYYVLSDWLGVANLADESNEVLRSWVFGWLGLPAPTGTTSTDLFLGWRQRLFAGCYAVASFVYRWVMLTGSLYALYLFLQPYRLSVLCLLAAWAAAATGLAWPVCTLLAAILRQHRVRQMKRMRLVVAALFVVGAVAAFFLVPIPRNVDGIGLIQADPVGQERVAVPDCGGFLASRTVEDGQYVQAGQVLAVLTNPRLQVSLRLNEAERQLRMNQYRDQVTWLAETRGEGRRGGNDLEQTRLELQGLAQQHRVLKGQSAQLTLRAPRAGTVIGLQPREHVGKWLDRGTELCRVCDVRNIRAVFLVEPADRQRISVGSLASLRIHGGADQSWDGVVSEVALVDAANVPVQLSSQAGGEVATRTDPDSHQEQPREQHYLVAIRLAQTGRMLHLGAMGRVHVKAEAKTLWWQVRRYLAQTFSWGP